MNKATLEEESHILFAYAFDGKGGATPIKENEVAKKTKSKELTWVHLDVYHPNTRKWLEKEIAYLDPFIIDALLADETRPRMTEIGDGALLIFRGVNLNENTEPDDMVSIRMWVDSYRIISLRIRKLRAVADVRELIHNKKGPKDSGDFVCMLTDTLFDRMAPVLAKLTEDADDAEEQVSEKPTEGLREEVGEIRKKAIIFRRYISPQRDVINQLSSTSMPWIKKNHKRYLHENLNMVTKYLEDLDSVRERAQVTKDELSAFLASKMNKNMYVISVLTAIFMPLTFLTGLFGMNVAGIPGAHDNNAFLFFSLIMATIVALQILIFKKYKWF